ncbi:MAG: hypothetical protein RBT04_10970 [Sphaerochaetaceae bacterium]|jgi:hypothetical protein|nr:hypothetical protein [Sphaerochaetaceae bacterium]
MKVGELYDVAQLIIPSITKRMFTVFYNISMEHLSRILRINILEDTFSTVAGYKDLPLSAVRIEGVSGTSTGIHKWDIVNNKLILYLPNDSGVYEAVTDLGDDTVTIKYWALIKSAIPEIDADGKAVGVDPPYNDWVEQDDENDSDVQICAVYMAMEEAASIIGATKEELDLIRGNFKQYIQRLYIKYNTSVIYQSLKQVSF